MEVWRDVLGYEGLYQVSSLGRVKSLDRVDCAGRKLKGIILQQSYTRAGYRSIGLSKDGALCSYRVNRLVAIAFINNPNNYPQVGHKDDNKENNSVDNLYWTTQKENNTHNNKHIRVGEKIGKAIQGDCGSNSVTFKSSLDAGKHGFNSSAIRNCLTGRSHTHQGYSWNYI